MHMEYGNNCILLRLLIIAEAISII